MRLHQMTVPLLLCFAALLTACTTSGEGTGVNLKPVVKVEVHTPKVPQALLTCKADPGIPGDKATQRLVAKYITNLHSAGEDCRYRLGKVGEILRDFETINHPAAKHK